MNSLLMPILIATSSAFAVLSILLVFVNFSKKRKQLKAVNQLSEKIKLQKDARKEVLSKVLADVYHYQDNDLKDALRLLLDKEKIFYQKIIDIFGTLDPELIEKLPDYTNDLLEPYGTFEPILAEMEPTPEESKPEEFKEEAPATSEEADQAKLVLIEVFNAYMAAFKQEGVAEDASVTDIKKRYDKWQKMQSTEVEEAAAESTTNAAQGDTVAFEKIQAEKNQLKEKLDEVMSTLKTISAEYKAVSETEVTAEEKTEEPTAEPGAKEEEKSEEAVDAPEEKLEKAKDTAEPESEERSEKTEAEEKTKDKKADDDTAAA